MINSAYGVSRHEARHLHFIIITVNYSSYKQAQYRNTSNKMQMESTSKKPQLHDGILYQMFIIFRDKLIPRLATHKEDIK